MFIKIPYIGLLSKTILGQFVNFRGRVISGLSNLNNVLGLLLQLLGEESRLLCNVGHLLRLSAKRLWAVLGLHQSCGTVRIQIIQCILQNLYTYKLTENSSKNLLQGFPTGRSWSQIWLIPQSNKYIRSSLKGAGNKPIRGDGGGCRCHLI